MILAAAVLLFAVVFVTCVAVYGRVDRSDGEVQRAGRHRAGPRVTEAELREFSTLAHASILAPRPAPETPTTGIIRLRPQPAVDEPAGAVALVEDTGPIGPFVPGIGRRLAPRTIPSGMRLERPTSTCRTCTSGGLVAGGRCIVCGNDEVPEYRNGVHP